MYIDSPLWVLKRNCPCCKEGDLELYTCEECKTVVAICNEIGAVFIRPLQIDLDKISNKENEVCYHCGAIDKLRRAKDYEIISLRLTNSEYE
jgi:hypothetical protein